MWQSYDVSSCYPLVLLLTAVPSALMAENIAIAAQLRNVGLYVTTATANPHDVNQLNANKTKISSTFSERSKPKLQQQQRNTNTAAANSKPQS